MNMGFGFVRIQTTHSERSDVYRTLKRFNEVHEVHDFFNELFVKVYADDLDHLGDTLYKKIKSTPGVLSTKTYTTKDLHEA